MATVPPRTLDLRLQMAYDANGNLQYEGRAGLNASTSSAVWRIRRLSYDANGNLTAVEWADGDNEFNNVWSDRESLSYS